MNAFGFPMYKIDSCGNVDFNYELLILNFFNFYNIDKCHRKSYLINLVTNNEEREKIRELRELTGYSDVLPHGFRHHSREEKISWFQNNISSEREFNRLYNEWRQGRDDEEINLGLPCDETFGYLREFLRCHGVNCNINCSYLVQGYNVGDIIACEGFFYIS